MSAADEVRELIAGMDGRQLRSHLQQTLLIACSPTLQRAMLEKMRQDAGRLQPWCDEAWIKGNASSIVRMVRAEIAKREG